MRRPPIRIRTFLLGTVLVLLLLPALAGSAAWLIERDHQQAEIRQRLNTALAYLTSNRAGLREPGTVQGFARLLNRLDLLAQLVTSTDAPPGKNQLYISPALSPVRLKEQARREQARQAGLTPTSAPAETSTTWGP
jgi:hypothetical protein